MTELPLSAAPPALDPAAEVSARRPKYIGQTETVLALGLTDNILSAWRRKFKGPPWRRETNHSRFEYSEADVKRIRRALKVLGEYRLGLHGVLPLV